MTSNLQTNANPHSDSEAPSDARFRLSSTTLLSPTEAVDAAPKVKRLSLISSEDLKTPTIAIPTIAVAVGSLAIWGSILYFGAYKNQFSPIMSFPFMTAACFASFTPVHDGTHYSIAKGHHKKLINHLVGYLSGIPLSLPFGIYRQMHLLHHKHTNTEKDPDVWGLTGPQWLRSLKWLFSDYFTVKSLVQGEVKNAKTFETVLYYIVTILAIQWMDNKGVDTLRYWIIPQRTAYWLLVWLFSYIPHRSSGDHLISAKDNIYKTTSAIGGILHSNGFNLAIPLLNQHLHNIHHLYPQLPFTHYGHIWAKHKDALIAAGTEINPVYDSKQGWKWDEPLDGSLKKDK
ncbi:hypothetical protein BGZ49_002839 [Haplosporangium sp. Z 27]|nr:hypothetical protein BGZ49_002839 [Haplosporangium sp. Z 27]